MFKVKMWLVVIANKISKKKFWKLYEKNREIKTNFMMWFIFSYDDYFVIFKS